MPSSYKAHNRLLYQKSPYLLQHAHNPVDWYPWGEEAFAKAKKENKPIFLSIGYSTCHWCHVMERESFEDIKIAEVLNQFFVPIKVDREERPDLDQIYMTAVTAMTGQGGWPLSVFLTPEKKPFYGGTYFPPYAKWGSPGFVDVLSSIQGAWQTSQDKVIHSSESLTNLIQSRLNEKAPPLTLSDKIFDEAFAQFVSFYDEEYGGFGNAPKFPSSHNLSFLLRYYRKTGHKKALSIVENTLDKMAQGGMYDHLGGGFHRYATDRAWQVPHFEKMLYDQAILARTYLEAYQITKKEQYAEVAKEIFDYVLRDMKGREGGFLSAEDADSYDPQEYTDGLKENLEKKEGAFYLWPMEEILKILEKEEAEIFCYHFGIHEEGNALSDPGGEFAGKNIIFRDKTFEETARHFKKGESDIKRILATAKTKLFKVRQKRPRPHCDDKVLVDWNGLMIASLSFGARVLNEEKYLVAAEKAAQFILNKMIGKNGSLFHRYREDEVAIEGTLEDYAFFIYGLLELYEATFNLTIFKKAIELTQGMIDLFGDKERGGFYLASLKASDLIFRPKEMYDGAIPSGNSIAALDLVRLYKMTLNEEWEKKTRELFAAFSHELSQRPTSSSQMLIAFDFTLGPSSEIVFAFDKEDIVLKRMIEELYQQFVPNKVVLGKKEKDKGEMDKLAPFINGQVVLEGKPTVYVCENHVCKLPVTDPVKFKDVLMQLK